LHLDFETRICLDSQRPVHRTKFCLSKTMSWDFCLFGKSLDPFVYILGKSLQFGKIWGILPACFVLNNILISYFACQVRICWLTVIKLILIYCQNFIFQSGTSTTLSIRLKSRTFT
jgi:hypothetical protein